MKLSKLILIIFSITLIHSCRKDDYHKEREYSREIIYFEIKNETSLAEMQNLMQNIEMDKFQLNGFKYTTQTTYDSLTYFFNIFDNLEYLHVFNIRLDIPSKVATFRDMGFENFSTPNLTNWETILIENEIIEISDSKKYGYLYIDAGEEEYWINELKKNEEISKTDFVWVYEPWCQTGG